MEKEIYIPNSEEISQLIEQAWQKFCEQARKAGIDINDETVDGFLKDCFVAGYCAGHNDIFGIIRDQINIDDELNNIIKQHNNIRT